MIEDLYHSLTIEEKTGGDFDPVSWVAVSGTYTGFIQPIGSSEVFEKGKAGEKATHRLYTAVDTPCEYGYRVTYNSQEYIMIQVIQPSGISGRDHHKEIILGLFE